MTHHHAPQERAQQASGWEAYCAAARSLAAASAPHPETAGSTLKKDSHDADRG